MKTTFGNLLARVESYGSPVLDERERSNESGGPNAISAPLVGGEPDPDAKYPHTTTLYIRGVSLIGVYTFCFNPTRYRVHVCDDCGLFAIAHLAKREFKVKGRQG